MTVFLIFIYFASFTFCCEKVLCKILQQQLKKRGKNWTSRLHCIKSHYQFFKDVFQKEELLFTAIFKELLSFFCNYFRWLLKMKQNRWYSLACWTSLCYWSTYRSWRHKNSKKWLFYKSQVKREYLNAGQGKKMSSWSTNSPDGCQGWC